MGALGPAANDRKVGDSGLSAFNGGCTIAAVGSPQSQFVVRLGYYPNVRVYTDGSSHACHIISFYGFLTIMTGADEGEASWQ
jgi:hypothetical protein